MERITPYDDIILKILDRLPVVRTKQLINALYKTFDDMNLSNAEYTLNKLQKDGYLLMSIDGYTMTKSAYTRITNELYEGYIFQENGKFFRLPKMKDKINENGLFNDAIDCLWLTVDLMPDALDFVVNESPWDLMFTVKDDGTKPSRVYQITRITKSREIGKIELLKALPKMDDALEFRNNIVRIAVVDSEKDYWTIPNVGIRFICIVDLKSEKGYRVLKKVPKEEIWKGYELND